MTDRSYDVLLQERPDGHWEARVPGIPALDAVGKTGNQALAELWNALDPWLKEQRVAGTFTSDELGRIWNKVFHSAHSKYRLPESAPGDFSVDNSCCVSCGVPQAVAPDLIGWTEEPFVTCYWKKQPETPQEFEQAFKIFRGQEVDCHRYTGNDPEIQARISAAPWPGGRSSFLESALWGATPESSDPQARMSILQRIWYRLTRRY